MRILGRSWFGVGRSGGKVRHPDERTHEFAAKQPHDGGFAPKPPGGSALTELRSVSLGSDFPTLLARVRPEVERRHVELWDAKLRAVKGHGAEVTAMVEATRDLTLRGAEALAAAQREVAREQGGEVAPEAHGA